MQANPWNDFFGIYLDLIDALKSELSATGEEQNPALDLLNKLEESIKNGEKNDETHRAIVEHCIGCFRRKSKEILLRQPTFFDEELRIFPQLTLDLARMWRERPLYRQGIWDWVEQLYVIGNVCLHPKKAPAFLRVVRQLREVRTQSLSQDQQEVPEELEREDQEEDIGAVVANMGQMMGFGDNPAMCEMMTDVAHQMQQVMMGNENPMALIGQMMSGDMSALGDLKERMESKMQENITAGRITEDDLQRQAEQMQNRFGGMQGMMQMATQMGVPLDELQLQDHQEEQPAAPPPMNAAQPALRAAKPAAGKKKKKSTKKSSK